MEVFECFESELVDKEILLEIPSTVENFVTNRDKLIHPEKMFVTLSNDVNQILALKHLTPKIVKNSNQEVYLYLYCNQIFVSENLLKSSEDKTFSKDQKAKFTTIYCYLLRNLTHNKMATNLNYKIAEEAFLKALPVSGARCAVGIKK